MSALPPIADIRRCRWDVRKVPKTDIQPIVEHGAVNAHPNALILFLIGCHQVGFVCIDDEHGRTPWANVYIGPGGVYVHGPWERVDVPLSEHERVCRQ